MASIVPGAVRGNHRHNNTSEFLLVFGGRYDFYYVQETEIRRKRFGDSQLIGIRINPGTAHALKNVGDDTLYVIAYYDRPYDFNNPDTITEKLM